MSLKKYQMFALHSDPCHYRCGRLCHGLYSNPGNRR